MEFLRGGVLVSEVPCCSVEGGVRIHPENARMSGRHGVQYAAQCLACVALTPVVLQLITNLSSAAVNLVEEMLELLKALEPSGPTGCFAFKKTPTPLRPPQDPRHRPTVGS